ncbi:VCBS repeat-containing protein [Colwellia sp. E2M01]|uniref:FG-GAP repeat domain-containing protein n=1 Tax=Colwellia sp. E2M01 TaxID=2841561 RepID=UPI001C0A4F30|nr:VCBS repeat-containing protein [Colwellia sp. E2M01]MBU2872051.1 VCBS repeat-containing protein [Colwellia sp. E2M01]
MAYIGYTGDGQWKAEWVRDQNIYWNVSFTLDNLTDVNFDWQPNNRNGQDIVLINQGNKFVDTSAEWNLPKGGDHWGVTHGDFNNDGWNDLFVYRYFRIRCGISKACCFSG